jgi:hypothetical protein
VSVIDRNEIPLRFIVSGLTSIDRETYGFQSFAASVDDGLRVRIRLGIRDPGLDLGKTPPPVGTPPRLSAGGIDVRHTFVKATYLFAIGVATCGWLWFIGWLAMHAI